MQSIEGIEVHASRLCQAIARIGYEPQIALMDIVDNAVTAKASTIQISLFLALGKTLKNRNSVQKYQVVDDGLGMTNDEIRAAFSLGANGKYGPHSLSKYGMGLKSAGLSLGKKIHIVSKKAGQLSVMHTFDVDLIAQQNAFVIQVSALTAEQSACYNNLIPKDSGTVVEIDGCESINHQSSSTTVRKLEEQMGVVYASYIEKQPLRIGIRVCVSGAQSDFKLITPLDILFREKAKAWDPESYDFLSPYLLLDQDWNPDLGDGKIVPPIRISAVTLPQDKLGSTGSPLNPEQQKIVRGYQVNRANAGCFIYRNNRLIRWGDKLEGILTKDEFNLRIRMDLTEEHDDVLHVDVTKQRLEIDDELLARLRRILDESRSVARQVMTKCSEYMKTPTGAEGAAFSELSANVPEDDPEEMASGAPSEEVLQRQFEQAAEAEVIKGATLQNSVTDAVAGAAKLGDAPFAKVRYTTEVEYKHLWTPYRDAKEGVFVCINTHHPFYTEFMADLADNSPERLLLEALMFGAGVGQINTASNLYEVELDEIKKVFNRFHNNCGSYLAEFTSENINLLDK